MEDDCKVLLDATVNPESRKQTQSVNASTKLTIGLLVVIFCLAASAAAALVLCRDAKGPGHHEDGVALHHTLRQLSNVRAAIHLQGEFHSDMTTSVEWKNQVDQSFSQGGLELNDNEIVIPRNGLYFVYSQASFRVSCSGDTDNTSSQPLVYLSYSVKRWSRTYGNDDAKMSYETILHATRTACSNQNQDGSWFSAVYMGAVFNLSTGDRLKTVMNNNLLSHLEDDPGKTFFGVFAL